jgi:hypothetical protein
VFECVHETRFFALGDLHRGIMRPVVVVHSAWAPSLLLLFGQLVCGWLGRQWSWPERIYTAALGAAGYFSLVYLVMLSVLCLFQSEQKVSKGPRRCALGQRAVLPGHLLFLPLERTILQFVT